MLLSAILEKLKKVSILVIGDMMLDHYIWGDVVRISPEAPVPVVHVHNDSYTPGGAANVALNLANLGVETFIIGHCGRDEAGDKLNDILQKSAINNVSTSLVSDVPTIIKTRVIIRGQQLCRIDREAERQRYNIAVQSNFFEQLDSILLKVDTVILSDYAKGVITQELIDYIISFRDQKKRKMLVAVDPKPSRHLDYSRVDLITPNKSEGLEMAGLNAVQGENSFPVEQVCNIINAKYCPDKLVLTLGAEGMAVCENGKILQYLPTDAKQVFDVSGAGDTVIATLAAALVSGADIVSAAKLANIAAGCVVSHMGTAPITFDELVKAVEDYQGKLTKSIE